WKRQGWPPVPTRSTLRISASAICSAATMAWRMSSSASEASVMSPLRTPRARDCPRSTMFSALSAESSPTTAQTLDVPISRLTMIEEEGSNMFLLLARGFGTFGRGRGHQRGFQPFGWNVVADGEIEGPKGFADLA